MNKSHRQSFSLIAVAIVALFAWSPAFAGVTDREDVLHTGNHSFQGPIDITGTLSISGTAVTASADQLNAVGGNLGSLGATAAELDAIADKSARVYTHTITTNAASTNLTLNATNTVIILAGGPNQTNALNIAASYAANTRYSFLVDSAVTNLITIADNGATLALGASLSLSGTDAFEIYATATNKAARVSGPQDN